MSFSLPADVASLRRAVEDDPAAVIAEAGALRDRGWVCLAADALRARQAGDVVTYVVNRNINFTNVCIKHCGRGSRAAITWTCAGRSSERSRTFISTRSRRKKCSTARFDRGRRSRNTSRR